MPDESCRICGGNLSKCTICAECKSATSMICLNCGSKTLDQYHVYCMYNSKITHKTNFMNQERKDILPVFSLA